MTMATTNDPTKHILVIHTSCLDNHLDEPSSSSAPDTSARRNASGAPITKQLHSIPIVCDVLLVPEIPAERTTPHPSDHPLSELVNITASNEFFPSDDLVEFVQNRFLPCGLVNVLVLENLPWQKVLLSLTSCTLVYEDGETVLLPVHPVPSTFDFRIAADDPSDRDNTSLDDPRFTTDLHLVFDVNQARLRLEEVFEGNSSLTGTTSSVDNPMRLASREKGTFVDDSSDLLLNLGKVRDRNLEDLFDSVINIGGEGQSSPSRADFLHSLRTMSLSEVGTEAFFRQRNNSTRLDHELEALRRVHAIMEHDAANLDRLLQVLSFVGLGLFVALVWSGFQLYQAKREDSFRMARLLHQSVEPKISLHSTLPSSLQFNCAHPTSPLAPVCSATSSRTMDLQLGPTTTATVVADTTTASSRPTAEGLCTPRTDNRSGSKLYSSGIKSIQPTRFDFFSMDDGGCQGGSRPGSTSARGEFPLPICNLQEDRFLFGKGRGPMTSPAVALHTTTEYPHIDVAANREASMSSFPRQKSRTDTCREETTIANDDDMNHDATLSPCTLLAKSWLARKTARRRHRKKNAHTTLRPLLSEGTGSSWSTVPKAFANPMLAAEMSNPGRSILAPLPLRPTTMIGPEFPSSSCGKATIGSGDSKAAPAPARSRENHIVSETLQDSASSKATNKSPWKGAPTIPDLVCSTPGSSDDSFVDDYW